MTYEEWLTYIVNNSLFNKSLDTNLWSQLGGKIDNKLLWKIVRNVTQTEV